MVMRWDGDWDGDCDGDWDGDGMMDGDAMGPRWRRDGDGDDGDETMTEM